MLVKDVLIHYCRDSGCPVQQTMDRHRQNQGSEDEIRWIKRAHCMRCDVWKVRKWLEASELRFERNQDEEESHHRLY